MLGVIGIFLIVMLNSIKLNALDLNAMASFQQPWVTAEVGLLNIQDWLMQHNKVW